MTAGGYIMAGKDGGIILVSAIVSRRHLCSLLVGPSKRFLSLLEGRHLPALHVYTVYVSERKH